MSEVDRLLAEIAVLWNRVERRTKEVEQYNGEVAIACINEMRYAGRRVVDVLNALRQPVPPSDTEIVLELGVAKNYLVNADHDLTDAVIVEIHHYTLRVLKKHGLKKVTKHLPEFGAFYPSISEANSIVSSSREQRQLRNAEYDRLANDYVPKLMELGRKLKSIKAIDASDDVRWSLHVITWLGIVGSVASLLGLGLAIWGIALAFNPPQKASPEPMAASQTLPPS